MTHVESARIGRPTAAVSRERRARFLELRARGHTLEEAIRELGCTAMSVIRMLDDPAFTAQLEAVRASLPPDAKAA